jgi:hypothetical protein
VDTHSTFLSEPFSMDTASGQCLALGSHSVSSIAIVRLTANAKSFITLRLAPIRLEANFRSTQTDSVRYMYQAAAVGI